jgi:hypothetical protein
MKSYNTIKPLVHVCEQRQNFISGDVESYRVCLKGDPIWRSKPQLELQQKHAINHNSENENPQKRLQ